MSAHRIAKKSAFLFVVFVLLCAVVWDGLVSQGVLFSPSPLLTKGIQSQTQGACCLCAYDTSLPGTSEECDLWLKNHRAECAVSRKIPYDSNSPTCWQDLTCGSAFSPGECLGKRLLFETFGHSTSDLCKPFADFTFQVCVESGVRCANVINNGCSTFENVFESYAYIESLGQSCPGIKVSITGNQCVASVNLRGGKRCESFPPSQSFCTISVSADCSTCTFADCNFGEECGVSSTISDCRSAICTDQSGNLANKICCDVNGQAVWAREGSCTSCEGSCCKPNGLCQEEFSFERAFKIGKGSNQQICEDEFHRGQWSAGIACADNVCVQKPGACCIKDKCKGRDLCEFAFDEEACLAKKDLNYDNVISEEESRCIEVKFNEEKSCEEIDQTGGCYPEGACCEWDICAPNGYSCSQLSRDQCYAKRTSCHMAQWTPDARCDEVFCDETGCRADNDNAFIGPDCMSCIDAMGRQYAWCSSSPDSNGNFCCGPA